MLTSFTAVIKDFPFMKYNCCVNVIYSSSRFLTKYLINISSFRFPPSSNSNVLRLSGEQTCFPWERYIY